MAKTLTVTIVEHTDGVETDRASVTGRIGVTSTLDDNMTECEFGALMENAVRLFWEDGCAPSLAEALLSSISQSWYTGKRKEALESGLYLIPYKEQGGRFVLAAIDFYIAFAPPGYDSPYESCAGEPIPCPFTADELTERFCKANDIDVPDTTTDRKG